MIKVKVILSIVFILLFSGVAMSNIINVPGDQPTIQQGIDAAVDGDTVLVQPGNYVENINYHGKNIVVGSLFLITQDTTYISQTIIDGNQNGSVVEFSDEEDSTAILMGFTVTNGFAYCGGGIYCGGSRPTLTNVTICENTADIGAGIFCSGSNPSLMDITISKNTATGNYGYGGGCSFTQYSSPNLTNVIINKNIADYYGGGICCISFSNPRVENVIISGNISNLNGGGIFCADSSNLSLTNTTIKENTATSDGGGIFCIGSSPSLCNVIIEENKAKEGGGICCIINSNLSLNNVIIIGNNANVNGGGIYSWDSNPSLTNVTITENTAINGGGVWLQDSNPIFDSINRCNILLNFGGVVNDFYAVGSTVINVIVDTFTVLQPDNYFACPIESFTFEILNAKIEPVDQDLYVSPTGSNNNSGLSADDPLLTISYALAKIIPNPINPHTIHLENGTYAPSQNREKYPLNCRSYVSLKGGEMERTILDAEWKSNILYCYNDNYFSIYNLKIQHGNAFQGGGICSVNSSSNINNVTIRENTANCGGGIAFNVSFSTFSYVTITSNTASGYYGKGGGIYCCNNSILDFDSDNRCNIYLNHANSGNDLYSYQMINVVVDTFTVMRPTNFHAFPIENFTFDILHAMQPQVNSDLYVSPDGNNSNSGLSWSEPLKTIDYALSIIQSDSLNPHTIHLSLGTYSPYTNGEQFPLSCISYISLKGSGVNETILDASNESNLIYFSSVEDATIENISIINGFSTFGGGIYCNNSDPVLFNIIIEENTTDLGGGIYCENSSPSLVNVTISGNIANNSGGGISCYDNSNPSLTNVVINGNTSDDFGGGIYCHYYSNPNLVNVIIIENIADNFGGGICCRNNSNISLTNVTISQNSASDEGGGICCWDRSSLDLLNCISYNDTPQEILFLEWGEPNSVNITYSDIQGGEEGIITNNNGTVYWLEGNIDSDPLFADPENGDFHLTWANFPIPDSTKSPCIDTGDPNSPLDPDSTRADMGAYYFDQSQQGTEDIPILSARCMLYQNYPNPFSASTTISFNIHSRNTENAEIRIYNVKGQLVRQLSIIPDKYRDQSSIKWNGKDEKGNTLSSGIYLYKLIVNNKTIDTKKCLLLR